MREFQGVKLKSMNKIHPKWEWKVLNIFWVLYLCFSFIITVCLLLSHSIIVFLTHCTAQSLSAICLARLLLHWWFSWWIYVSNAKESVVCWLFCHIDSEVCFKSKQPVTMVPSLASPQGSTFLWSPYFLLSLPHSLLLYFHVIFYYFYIFT